MLRHVVMWKIDQAALPEGETSHDAAERLSAALRALEDQIPGVVALSAYPDLAGSEGNWDFGLTVDFETAEDLEAYQVDPLHQAVVSKIRAVVADRACVDIAV